MPITYPMAWAEFAGMMPIQSAPLKLRRFEEVAWSASGRPDVSELAEPRWSAQVTLAVLHWWEAGEIETLIEMHGSAHPLYLHDPLRPGPRLDPDGAILGAATPVIASVTSEGVAIGGLPSGYALSRGDLLSIDHVIGGIGHRALYAVAAPATANGAGVTPVIPLLPTPRPMTAVDQQVRLIGATAQMIILPDSYDPGSREGQVVRGMRFDVVESW